MEIWELDQIWKIFVVLDFRQSDVLIQIEIVRFLTFQVEVDLQFSVRWQDLAFWLTIDAFSSNILLSDGRCFPFSPTTF